MVSSFVINLSAHADCPNPADITIACNKSSCTFTNNDKNWQFIENFDSYIDKKNCKDKSCLAEKKEWIEKFKKDSVTLEFTAAQFTKNGNLKEINFCKYEGLNNIDAIPLAPIAKPYFITLNNSDSVWKVYNKAKSTVYTCLTKNNDVKNCQFNLAKS